MKAALAAAAAVTALASWMPAGARPALCTDPCTVQANIAGYLPPVVGIASGTRVLWETTDVGSHPTSDADDPAARCYLVPVGGGVEPVPVRFDVDGDELVATEAPGTVWEASATCVTTRAPEASHVLTFHCLLHPWMRAVLAVSP